MKGESTRNGVWWVPAAWKRTSLPGPQGGLASASSSTLPSEVISLISDLVQFVFFSKPFNTNTLFLFSLQLCDIYTFLGYPSQMRLHCIASDLCQKELQMFQRKCAETMQLKQNKLCLKWRKCPNKWEMHRFLWEFFPYIYHLCLFLWFFVFFFSLLCGTADSSFTWKSLQKGQGWRGFLEFLKFSNFRVL